MIELTMEVSTIDSSWLSTQGRRSIHSLLKVKAHLVLAHTAVGAIILLTEAWARREVSTSLGSHWFCACPNTGREPYVKMSNHLSLHAVLLPRSPSGETWESCCIFCCQTCLHSASLFACTDPVLSADVVLVMHVHACILRVYIFVLPLT